MNEKIKELLDVAKGYVESLEYKNEQGLISDADIDIINDAVEVWYQTDISIRASRRN